jgi:hypothetical protein
MLDAGRHDAVALLSPLNFGAFPMSNGLTRLRDALPLRPRAVVTRLKDEARRSTRAPR